MISKLATAEKIEREYRGKVLQLALLGPAVMEAIFDGRQGAVEVSRSEVMVRPV